MNEQASSWLTAIDGLPEIHERLKRVVVLNEDAVTVIRREDSLEHLLLLRSALSTRYSGHEV
jgi:hypothetical protein